ncbi:hypothetical protein C8R44DRAFT_808283 [Mycena epipterygia]|nr:hypothetical protein C8R44DRAFT_808283 [Mycena epipterygia]
MPRRRHDRPNKPSLNQTSCHCQSKPSFTMDVDHLQASLRELTIRNHRLESQVGELEIINSHHREDLAKARAERDRYQEEAKDVSVLRAELKHLTARYEVLKLSSASPVLDHKRKRDAADDTDLKFLAPAFNEQKPLDRQNAQNLWSSMNTANQFLSRRYDSAPTTPQRPSMSSYLSSSTDSSSASTDSSPRASPMPGLQSELRTVGVHSTPWSQHGNNYSLQSSPTSTRSSTPMNMADSQRTTDPRKRIKLDSDQTTPTRNKPSADQNATPTTTTTTHITQISSTVTSTPPKHPKRTPSTTAPEGPRIPSEYRKRTVSLVETPLRSTPRHHRNDAQEAGELTDRKKLHQN